MPARLRRRCRRWRGASGREEGEGASAGLGRQIREGKFPLMADRLAPSALGCRVRWRSLCRILHMREAWRRGVLSEVEDACGRCEQRSG